MTSAVVQSVIDYTEQCVEHSADDEVMSLHAEIQSRIDREIEEQQKEWKNLEPMEEADMGVEVSCAEDLKQLYRTAWELPQKALIDLGAARGPYIDQSQSLNLFMATPTIGKLSSMYLYAWKAGLKTTYYLRSRPATRIRQTQSGAQQTVSDQEAVACSLENPESCEACQ